ncbi:BamA/TamA family outer membrane protein [Mesorhizobium sp. M0621]|uniref:ShlB/FhaC/HecB family hemolysin secretion/activation protein n=1 Tax=Mesorhizobium sp. M0621 TaxID=2956974 RepID=UPI00333AA472
MLLLAATSLPTLAQDAGSLLREQQRQQELQRLRRLPQPEEPGRQPALIAGPERGETIILRELRFAGKIELLPEAERAQLAATVKGKRLGIAGLYALADKVTAALQRQGRLLARAVLPQQDITEGFVTIKIVEGVFEKTDFERGKGVRVREGLLRAIGEGQVQADSVTKEDLEEALLRMNDLPGVSARAKLTPGSAPNTTRLVVGVDEAPIFSASLWGDDYGSASTGKAQGNALVTLTDMTGFGELARLMGTFSEGQKFSEASLSMPLGATGLTASANYGYLDYHNIDDFGSALGLQGYAQFAGLGLDYSLIRSRDLNVRLSTGLDWKALIDDSIVGRLQDKRSLSGTLGLSGDMRDAFFGGGLTNWSLGWTYGDLDLAREGDALEVDQAGLQTQGAFHRLNASAARLQDLPGDFSLFGLVYGQWSSKNLDSSEDFSLGGPYGVRGWPVGEGRGDMGLLGTMELRYDAPVPSEFGSLQLAGLLDAGRIWINKNQNGIPNLNVCGCNDYSLASAGLSLRWTHEALNVSATWAYGLGKNPGRSNVTDANADGNTGNQQFWLRGAIRF